MDHFRRRHRVQRGFALGIVFAVLAVSPAAAWTQLDNEYPNSPVSCTDINPYYCIEWPTTPGGLSVNVDVYLDSTLDLITSVPFKSDIRASIPQWNNIAARNPHLQETTSTTGVEALVWASLDFPSNVYGVTFNSVLSSNPRQIAFSEIIMSRQIAWNHTYTFTCYQPEPGTTVCRADARKVSTHELGHAEGLGHTGISPAVMRTGAVTYWTPQANDKAGIVAIYGAYP